MKIHLVRDKNKMKLYTYELLDYLLELHKIADVEPEEADLFLVSMDDPDDLNLLRRARRTAGDKPLIVGGFEAFGGEYLLSEADALCVGEGWEFFEELAVAPDVDHLLDLPYVMTKDKEVIYPSTYIDLNKVPAVKTSKKSWYFLAGRGCRNKCAFCMTSFVYPTWSCPNNVDPRSSGHDPV